MVWSGPIPGVHVPDIFDEVSEDLRAERAQRLLQRYGFLLVIAAVLIVAGAGGWQAWRWRQAQTRAAVATSFLTACANRPPARRRRRHRRRRCRPLRRWARTARAATAPSRGCATPALKVSAGRPARAALALWNQVSADDGADPQLRHLADLLWVQHQIDAGDPAAVEGRLAPLIAPGNPWRPLALESQAWLNLRTGDTKGAAACCASSRRRRPRRKGCAARANGLLQRLGEAPGAPASEPEKQG